MPSRASGTSAPALCFNCDGTVHSPGRPVESLMRLSPVPLESPARAGKLLTAFFNYHPLGAGQPITYWGVALSLELQNLS